jgi:hypothetical protein
VGYSLGGWVGQAFERVAHASEFGFTRVRFLTLFLVVTHSHSNRAAISEMSQTWPIAPTAIAGVTRQPLVNLGKSYSSGLRYWNLSRWGDKLPALQHHKGECSQNEACFNPILSWIAFE